MGVAEQLEDVVEDDTVKVWGTVFGSWEYDMQAGGRTVVPAFIVDHIEVLD